MVSARRLPGKTLRGVATTVVAGAFALVVVLIIVRPVENLSRDLMITTLSPFDVEPAGIVLVTVTEETLAGFPYRSPVDRGFLAALIERIDAGGPRAIGVDVLFDQPSEPEKDAALEAALLGAKSPVVIAAAGQADGLTEQQARYLANFEPSVRRGLAVLLRDSGDGVVRRRFAGRDEGGEWRPGFASAVAQSAGVPENRSEGTLVYYRTKDAAPFAFPAYPAHAAALLPPDWFADKLVLIGVDLPDNDRHATPFVLLNGAVVGSLPGLAIHAHALAQLLRGDRIRVVPWPVAAALALLVAGFCGWMCYRPGPVVAKPMILIAVLAVWWSAAATAFATAAALVPVAAPTFAIVGVGALASFFGWRRDSAERRFIENAFSKYVSPAVVQDIISNPSRLRLGGERRQITCVFTDMEGFTTLSEQLGPEKLAPLLNDYLDEMCNLFVEHGATIDKVIGDAVVGFFGAPSRQDDQASDAVALAFAIDDFSQRFREAQLSRGIKLGVTRVGVHGGAAIVGNFGGKRFFDYTAMGDTVNTAARLEGANKYLGTRICVSEAVARDAPQTFRPGGVLIVKGRSAGIATFEPLNSGAPESIYLEDYLEAYAAMVANSPRALAAFEELGAKHPDDRLVAFHRQRLAECQTGDQIVLEGK